MNQDYLKEVLHYDPDTGIFIRIKGRLIGSIAGGVDKSTGYVKIRVGEKKYKAHRLAFLYMTGSIPEQVDHLDHIRDNNAWINLRAASQQINGRNRTKPKNNTSGFVGVRWFAPNRKWLARIRVDDVLIHLGYFETNLAACMARHSANVKYEFHENHGL